MLPKSKAQLIDDLSARIQTLPVPAQNQEGAAAEYSRRVSETVLEVVHEFVNNELDRRFDQLPKTLERVMR